MSAELHIPDAAASALLDICDEWVDDAELNEAVATIAAPVVAAELRRIADDVDAWSQPADVLPEPRTLAAVAARLRARANQLDKSGGQS